MGWFRQLKKAFVDFFGNIKFYKGGVVFFGSSTYKIKGPDMREILNILKPGDVLLNKKDHYVSNLFIKGNFSHAGLYVGNDSVIHVIGDGILKEDILTFMRADAFAVVRPTNQELVAKALEHADIQLGRNVQYDYDFDKNSPEEFYCSEFTDYCYGYLLRDRFDEPFIYPDTYINAAPEFKVVWIKKN